MTDTNDPILVYGATGVQGGAVLNRLRTDGHSVLAQTSTPDHRDALEATGADVAVAGLDDPDALVEASAKASKVVLSLPQGYASEAVRRFGRNAIDAAETAAVDLLVLNTSTRIPEEETNVAAFEDKRELEQYGADSEVPFVSLRPTLFMENFALPQGAQALVEDDIVAYPIPAELPAAWISARDLAAFVAEALAHPEWAGRRIDIGGPELLDGPTIAERFSMALGRQVTYQQVPVDAFEAQLTELMGPEAGRMIPEMYRWAGDHLDAGLFGNDPDLLARDFRGVELMSLETWAGRQEWEELANPAGTHST